MRVDGQGTQQVDAALAGMRVIELASAAAGPTAAMLLADFGAEVVEVESPRGDLDRARPGFLMWGVLLPWVADLPQWAGHHGTAHPDEWHEEIPTRGIYVDRVVQAPAGSV